MKQGKGGGCLANRADDRAGATTRLLQAQPTEGAPTSPEPTSRQTGYTQQDKWSEYLKGVAGDPPWEKGVGHRFLSAAVPRRDRCQWTFEAAGDEHHAFDPNEQGRRPQPRALTSTFEAEPIGAS